MAPYLQLQMVYVQSVRRVTLALLSAASLVAAGGCPIEPAIPSASPNSGPSEGGTKVTIRGLAFAPDTGVLFGGQTAAQVRIINASLIEAYSPAHEPGLVDIALVGAYGTTTMIPGAFEYIAPQSDTTRREPEPAPGPAALDISIIKPTSGPAAGGTPVALEGAGFVGGMTAFFGDAPGVTVQFISPATASTTTPINVHGPCDLRLVAPDGREITMTAAFTYMPNEATDPGTDTDGDGLTDLQELTGRLIQIDDAGFGPGADGALLSIRNVTSDPKLADTDGDGLDDRQEYFLQTDPRSVDTDGDGLTDEEEWTRWHTSPVSIDTDGDARDGLPNQPPNAALFDGAELYTLSELSKLVPHPASSRSTRLLKGRATSPTLSDTDGDGKSDFAESDDAVRSSLIADLPRASVTFEGEVDIRLFVQYEESEGQEEQYGDTFTTIDTNSTSKTTSESTSVETAASKGFIDEITGGDGGIAAGLKGFAVNKALELGQKALCGALDVNKETSPRFNIDNPQKIADDISNFEDGLSATADAIGICNMGSPKTTKTNTTSLTMESSHTAQQEHSKYLRESRERSETAARGEIRAAVRIQNSGAFTYQVGGLFLTAMHWQSSPNPAASFGDGAFRTVGTLRPSDPGFFAVLGPGESTPQIEMTAENVNPAVIKELLARPSAIFYSPASFELSDPNGLNLDFVTEQVFARTATILIDYGGGVEEQYEVATNVDRDASGKLAGLRLGTALAEVLGIPFETQVVDGVRVLTGVRNIHNVLPNDLGDVRNGVLRSPLKMWSVYFQQQNFPQIDTDFEELLLKKGDVIRIIYTRDDDGDGLFSREELALGTSDADPDADGDGLTDFEETKVGWTVSIDYEQDALPDVEYQVFSSPTQDDQDADGLTDGDERALGTDPGNPDTDDDTLTDGIDPYPLIPARRLYVNISAAGGDGSGSTWENASADLQGTLNAAKANNDVNNPDYDPKRVVSEIWVAEGTYTPPAAGFLLVDGVQVYGGFKGTERRRAARENNPITNGTVLSGDPTSQNPGHVANIVIAESLHLGATLDGFTVQRGGKRATGQNGIFEPNSLQGAGAGIKVLDSEITLANLWFRENHARDGGALAVNGGPGPQRRVSVRNCRFEQSRALKLGGAAHVISADIEFVDCDFNQNQIGDASTELFEYEMGGGALYAEASDVNITRCRFNDNRVSEKIVDVANEFRYGGALLLYSVNSTVASCSFNNNRVQIADVFNAPEYALVGGGVMINGSGTHDFVNCRFLGNSARYHGGGLFASGPSVHLTNCTLAGNKTTTSGGNNADTAGVRGPVSLNNCIVWGNLGEQTGGSGQFLNQVSETAEFNNTLVQGLNGYLAQHPEAFFGFANIDGDPLFVSLQSGDLRLMPGSPCIDTGNRLVDIDHRQSGFQTLPDADLGGDPRVVNGDGLGDTEVDMGAYEFQPSGG